MLNGVEPQETEVVAKAKRRSFTAEYKRDIVRRADACTEPGAIGALLRGEGLFSSHLTVWRREVKSGELAALEAKKRGPKAQPVDPREFNCFPALVQRHHFMGNLALSGLSMRFCQSEAATPTKA